MPRRNKQSSRDRAHLKRRSLPQNLCGDDSDEDSGIGAKVQIRQITRKMHNLMRKCINIQNALDSVHAKNTFLSAPELMGIVASEIDDANDLKNLCLVNKAFNELFGAVLFRRLDISVVGACAHVPQRLQNLIKTPPARLRYTLVISVKFDDSQGHYCLYDLGLTLERQLWDATQKLVQHAPALRAFRFDFPTTMDVPGLFHSMPSSDVDCPLQLQYLDLRDFHGSVTLSPMIRNFWSGRNLRSLTFHALDTAGEDEPLRDDGTFLNNLVDLLAASPNLKYLSIQLARGRLERSIPWARATIPSLNSNGSFLVDHLQQVADLFKNLCHRYEKTGARPLELETLELGTGMVLIPDEKVKHGVCGEAKYLRLLTNPEYLVELHLWNNRCQWELAWDTISPTVSPNLKRLHIEQISEAGYRHFSSLTMAPFLRNLFIHIKEGIIQFDDEDFAPFWRKRPAVDDRAFTIDLFTDEGDDPIQPRGLSLSLHEQVSEPSFQGMVSGYRDLSPGWSELKFLEVEIYMRRIHPSSCDIVRTCSTFIRRMPSLEYLSIRIRADTRGLEEQHFPKRKLSIMRVAVNSCPRLKFIRIVGLNSAGTRRTLDLQQTRDSESYRVVHRNNTRHSGQVKQGRSLDKVYFVKTDGVFADDATPIEFWSDHRKAMQYVRNGPF